MTKRVTARGGRKVRALLVKRNRALPAIAVHGRTAAVIRAGTVFSGAVFKKDTPVTPPAGGYVAGADYAVQILRGKPLAQALTSAKLPPRVVGGFHCAPGGNAKDAKGGDGLAAINPHSVWDVNFRPACKDPRGMALIVGAHGSFWCDIYLLGVNHLTDGTSRFGATIADGNDRPQNPAGGTFAKFDFAAATAVFKHHGKTLLGAEDFFAAALGITERSSAASDPKVTGCDPARTSRTGIMQATGNMWVWGTDGHPTDPRPSLFGGSWISGSRAGSRCADLGYWPGNSHGSLGARGRSDHLQRA